MSQAKPTPRIKRKVKKPAQKPVIRQFFMDDDGKNKVHLKTTEKTIVIFIQLATDGTRMRKIGTVTRSTNTLTIRRKKQKHLFHSRNAYGFNEYILRMAKTFDTISLSDEENDWKVPVSFILEHGKHLMFKQSGFETQLFVSLDQLEPFKILKKEGRRL